MMLKRYRYVMKRSEEKRREERRGEEERREEKEITCTVNDLY